MKEKTYDFKWHRNPYIITDCFILRSISLFLLIIACFWEINKKEYIPAIILITSIFVLISINLFLFIYSFFYGWNRIIYFNKEKVWQKIKGQTYEWRWADMTSCNILFRNFKLPLILEIETKPEYRKLSLAIGECRYRALMRFCPNEKLKSLLKEKFQNS